MTSSGAIERADATSDGVAATALAAMFTERYGQTPSGVFAAPGRVNLIGEHTDYNAGWCLPVALEHSTFAAVAPRTDGEIRIASLQQDETFTGAVSDLTPDSIEGWAAYAAGVLWSLREAGVVVPGMDLLIDSQVPVGAGLSSSAAIECAVALAACSVADVNVDGVRRQQLVKVCMRAEGDVAGAPTGGMDQTVSMLAQASSALLIDCLDWTTTNVPWRGADVGVELLVVDTRVSHSLSDGQYGDRAAECERAVTVLGLDSLREIDDLQSALEQLTDDVLRRRVRHVVTENERVLAVIDALDADDFSRVGEIFDASHASLRDDFEVSCDELDAVVEAAGRAGALGARMTGGGFGGSAVVLARTASVRDIEQAVARAFADNGWTPPLFLRGVPSAGARGVPLQEP